MMLKYILTAVVSYILGSFSIAIIITKHLLHRDVRGEGSGNAGATNVARIFGIKMGLVTLFGDFLKTVLSALIGKALCGDTGLVVACAFCMIGHNWPVFFGFRGGKGVSTGAMMALLLDWRLFLILVAVFGLMFLISRRVSLCSITCGVAFPIVLAVLGTTTPRLLLGVFIALVILFQHRVNIKRLFSGTEPEFKAKF